MLNFVDECYFGVFWVLDLLGGCVFWNVVLWEVSFGDGSLRVADWYGLFCGYVYYL